MSSLRPEDEARAGGHPAPPDDIKRSGEGAATALEALIRQRKLAEGPDGGDPAPAHSAPPVP